MILLFLSFYLRQAGLPELNCCPREREKEREREREIERERKRKGGRARREDLNLIMPQELTIIKCRRSIEVISFFLFFAGPCTHIAFALSLEVKDNCYSHKSNRNLVTLI